MKEYFSQLLRFLFVVLAAIFLIHFFSMEFEEEINAFNAHQKKLEEKIQAAGVRGSKELVFEKAMAYIKSKRNEEAIVELKRLLDNGVEDANVYYLMGLAYHSLRYDRQSIEHYEKAIALNPDHLQAKVFMARLKKSPQLFLELAEFFYNQKKWELSASYYLKLREFEEEGLVEYRLGLIKIQQSKYSAAVAYLDEAIVIDSKNEDFYFMKSVAQLKMKQVNTAIETLKTGLQYCSGSVKLKKQLQKLSRLN